jgi:hypothetical protein
LWASRLRRVLENPEKELNVKTVLKYVGNFVELGYSNHPNAPSLVLSRGKRATPRKEEVVAYLRSGMTFVFSPGLDEDVLDPSKHADSASVLTDGVYAWQKTLAYYVDTYDVELPAEFEAHMQRNRWTIPSEIDKLALELPRYST